MILWKDVLCRAGTVSSPGKGVFGQRPQGPLPLRAGSTHPSQPQSASGLGLVSPGAGRRRPAGEHDFNPPSVGVEAIYKDFRCWDWTPPKRLPRNVDVAASECLAPCDGPLGLIRRECGFYHVRSCSDTGASTFFSQRC